jgi:hypothetical protein
VIVLAVFTGCLAFLAWLGVYYGGQELLHGNPWDLIALAIAAVCAYATLLCAKAAVDAVGLTLRPVPLFRLDATGVESAFGRVAWRQVQNVEGVSEVEGEDYYLFTLRPGEQPATSERAYFNGSGFLGSVKRSSTEFKLPVYFRDLATVLNAIRRLSAADGVPISPPEDRRLRKRQRAA